MHFQIKQWKTLRESSNRKFKDYKKNELEEVRELGFQNRVVFFKLTFIRFAAIISFFMYKLFKYLKKLKLKTIIYFSLILLIIISF